MIQYVTCATIWVLGFLVSALAVFLTFSNGWIRSQNLAASLSQLSLCYLPFLVAIAFFEMKRRSRRGSKKLASAPTLVLVLSITWNLLVVVVSAMLYRGDIFVEDYIYLLGWAGGTALVAGGGLIGSYLGQS